MQAATRGNDGHSAPGAAATLEAAEELGMRRDFVQALSDYVASAAVGPIVHRDSGSFLCGHERAVGDLRPSFGEQSAGSVAAAWWCRKDTRQLRRHMRAPQRSPRQSVTDRDRHHLRRRHRQHRWRSPCPALHCRSHQGQLPAGTRWCPSPGQRIPSPTGRARPGPPSPSPRWG